MCIRDRGGVGPFVIHDGVELAGLEPFLSGADNFGGGVGVGVDGADVGVPFAPKGMGHAEGHIQPPAVYAFFGASLAGWVHPAAGDVENIFFNAGMEVGFVAPEIGQDAGAVPTGVVECAVGMPAGHLIPVGISGCAAIFLQIAKGETGGAGVVEDAIQNDAHASRMDVGDQLQKKTVGGGPNPGGRVFGFVGGGDGAQIACAVGAERGIYAVSYTHLDVYKRQHMMSWWKQFLAPMMSSIHFLLRHYGRYLEYEALKHHSF